MLPNHVICMTMGLLSCLLIKKFSVINYYRELANGKTVILVLRN